MPAALLRTFQPKGVQAWVIQLQAGCGWWVGSRTSQHWPEEGSVVSGRVGTSPLAVVFWVLGHRRGMASPGRGDLSQPHTQQPGSVISLCPSLW